MNNNTPLSKVATSPNEATFPGIAGHIKTVFDYETKTSQKNGKPYKTQAVIIEDASGNSAFLRLYDRPEFRKDQVGDLLQISASNSGSGIKKVKYQSNEGEEKWYLQIGRDARIGDAGSHPAKVSQQRETGNPLSQLGDLYLLALQEVARIAPQSPVTLTPEMQKDIATSLFIEANRKGIQPPKVAVKQAPPAAQNPAPKPPPEVTPERIVKLCRKDAGSPKLLEWLRKQKTETLDKAMDTLLSECKEKGGTDAAMDAVFAKIQGKGNERTIAALGDWTSFVHMVTEGHKEPESDIEPDPFEEVGM